MTSASAATYYVDRTNGNDANSGTSPSSPWRSVPGMAGYSGSKSLAPGDTVYFDIAAKAAKRLVASPNMPD